MLTVRETSSDKDFYALRSAWNDLLLKSRSNNLFLTWEWLYNWWETFGSHNELRILQVRENENLIGIAPFFVTGNRDGGRKQINFLGSQRVGSDYLDLILLKGQEQETLSAIFDYLLADRNSRPVMNLTDIPENSRCIDLIKNNYRDRFYILRKDHTLCPYITLPESYEAFLKSLSSNMRYNIRRKRRRFENKFKGEFVIIRKKSELDRSIGELIRLNIGRMEMKKITSPFCDKGVSEFHRRIIPAFFDRGWLRLCFLKVGNDLIACLYVFKYEGKYYYYQIGFDPAWEGISPGTLLFSYCIEHAILEGMREFDLLQGRERYKFSWTRHVRKNMKLKLYNKTLSNRALYLGENLKLIVKSRIKGLLKRKDEYD